AHAVRDEPIADIGLLNAARRPFEQRRDVETSCGGPPIFSHAPVLLCMHWKPPNAYPWKTRADRMPALFVGLCQEVDMMTRTSIRSSIPVSRAVFLGDGLSRCQFTDSTSARLCRTDPQHVSKTLPAARMR